LGPTAQQRVTRLDTHCHSNASSGPVNAAVGFLGCPESFSPPEKVYDQAMARGMDLFTLTDHDTIDGAALLVERGFPRVVIGEEVTVHFPEDRCRLHVLVWCLSRDLHEEIGELRLRDDVYAFARWLRDRNLPHSLAHPLYIQNRKLSLWHLERCALLFKGFETLNGAHSSRHQSAIDTFLRSLTPGRVHRLIEQHSLEPLWPRIWEKARTGGSDDHALLNVGRAWTGVSEADALATHVPDYSMDHRGKVVEPREFFRVVMSARCEPAGEAGHSSLLAHQVTTVAANFYSRRLARRATPTGRAVAHKLLAFAGVSTQRPSRARLGLHLLLGRVRRKRRPLSPLLHALAGSFRTVLDRYPDLQERLNADRWDHGSAISSHDRMAAFADDLYSAMHALLGADLHRAAKSRDARRLTDMLTSYAVLELSQLPYLFSLFHQNKERTFVEHLEHETGEPGAGTSPLERPMRVMLFTDTLGDVNGVSRFIRNAGEQAQTSGRDLQIVTSTNFECPNETYIHNFPPVFAAKMPRYEHLELALPPLVRMLRFVDRHQPDVIHISTPGPVGIVGLIAARMLRVPIVGVYHTDFPAYVEHLFDDDSLAYFTSQFMRLFYTPFRSIFTRSVDYVASLERLGMPRDRILPLMPGIMTETFHPRWRDEALLSRLGSPPGRVRVLYVGRVSIEKNLPLLTDVWGRADAILRERGIDAELVIVGDGPYRAEMERSLRAARTRFLGFRYAEELSRIYATCDLFVFPSITDTLGQVVMESQASGMPALVSEVGGPKEVVVDGHTGYVLPHADPRAWAARIVDLATDAQRREQMGRAAHAAMQTFSMARSFEHFWQVHESAWVESLARKGIRPRSGEQSARGIVDPVPYSPMAPDLAPREFEHA